MRTRSVVVASAVVAVTGAVLAGVFLRGGPAVGVNSGPLGGGPTNGSLCGSGRRIVSIAQDDFRNATNSPIRVEKATLVNARGVKMLGADLVPIVAPSGQYDLLVTGGPYPPSATELAAAADARWGDRRTLPMTMAPDRPGHSWNLVFGLDRTAATGTADYQLQYQWHGNQYIWSSPTALKLVAGRCS